VSALSGMVRSADGERLAFSLMVNESPSQTRAKRVENQIGARLAEFRRSPGTAPPVVAETPPPERIAGFNDRHRVASGENLSSIATRYGVTVDEILQVNPRIQGSRIIAGQWIQIPQREGGL
jgi:LysM repeat protein